MSTSVDLCRRCKGARWTFVSPQNSKVFSKMALLLNFTINGVVLEDNKAFIVLYKILALAFK